VGFVASNVDPLPAVVRAEDVYPLLGFSRAPELPRTFVDPCAPDGAR
jgi:hypothetical protein